MPKVLVAVLLALLACALPAVAQDAYLIGGVVAVDASKNEDGLIDISGIQSAVWDVELPWVADLQVYLRWEGEGEHALAIELVGSDGETLDSIEDNLDFEQYSTSFNTYELPNVVFEKPDVYDVLIFLDDELVQNIPYCVNAEEEDYPTDPVLLASIPAVDGWQEDDGSALVEGAFEHFTFRKFPASDDFAVVTVWFSGEGTWEHRTEIRDPSGKVIAAADTQYLDAWLGEMVVLTDYFDNVLFQAAGDYEVAVIVDEEEFMTYLLRVVRGN